MTIEELRDYLNELIERDPESKDKEVLLEYWGFEDYESVLNFDSITGTSYETQYYGDKALVLKAEEV
jgi:hypothetical protein